MLESVFCVFYNSRGYKYIILNVGEDCTLAISLSNNEIRSFYDNKDVLFYIKDRIEFEYDNLVVNKDYKEIFFEILKNESEDLEKEFIVDLVSNVEFK